MASEQSALSAELAALVPSSPDRSQLADLLIDFLASVFAGARTCLGRTLATRYARDGARGLSFTLSYLAEISEFSHGSNRSAGHIGSTPLPLILGCAGTADDANGYWTEGAIVGYEAFARIGQSFMPELEEWGAYSTGFAGAMGAAAGLARALDLGADGINSAMGIAAYLTPFSAMDAYGAGANSAEAAVATTTALQAAELAALGVQGSHSIIDELQRRITGRLPLAAFRRPGDDQRAIHYVYWKPFPCCRFTHGAIEAILSLSRQITADEIDSIDIFTTPRAVRICGQTPSRASVGYMDRQFSLAFMASIAVLERRVTPELVLMPTLSQDAAYRAFADRVNVSVRQDLTRHGNVCPTVILVHLCSGEMVKREVLAPWGCPTAPMTSEQIKQKFHDGAVGVLTGAEIEEWLDNARELAWAEIGRRLSRWLTAGAPQVGDVHPICSPNALSHRP